MALKDVTFFNGQKMPIVGLGTWQSSSKEVAEAVEIALETGYRHIDTAFLYQNEAAIGKVLKKWFDSGRLKRKEIFIVTKLPGVGNRAECVEKYLKLSLAALQLDYVDLYLIHHPVGLLEKGDSPWPTDSKGKVLLDNNTDLLSLWKGMEAQVDAGRARNIGLSNCSAPQVKRIYQAARIKPANLQVELHLYYQRKELAAFCKALDIIVCAYAPIGSPGFAEHFKKIGGDTNKLRILKPLSDTVVKRIAEKHNKSPAQVLLKNIMQRGIVVIPKSVNPSRIKENFDVFDFELSPEEMQELYTLDLGKSGRMFDDQSFSNIFASHPENPYDDEY